jgi:hypothetical protein
MGKKHERRGLPPLDKPVANAAIETTAAASRGWRGFVLGNLFGAAAGFIVRPLAAAILGFAGVFLGMAWLVGPQPMIDHARYSKYTARADGHVIDSWLALEFDPGDMGSHRKWRPFAKAAPCAVVEYSGDWGQPSQRAFCGNRFAFNDSYTLHDLDTLAPKVPFAWMRDERGFAVPQIRMSPKAKAWLAANAPPDTFMMSDPPPKTELQALQVEFDRPLDHAIAGWTKGVPAFPLAFDPQDPAAAMPAGFVQARLQPQSIGRWVLVLIIGAIGLLVWFEGMAVLLSGLPLSAAILASVLPLLALPWWADQFPRALARLSPQVAQVIGGMFADFDPTGRLMASEPRRATLAEGERMEWRVGKDTYADTLGRIHFTAPAAAPASANAALATLADIVTAQTRAFDTDTQNALFTRLRDDKVAGLRRTGLVFVPAAKAALLDSQGDPAVQRAARRFLLEWTTSPTELPDAHDPAYRERMHLFAILGDVPVPEIANMVQSAVAIDAGTR